VGNKCGLIDPTGTIVIEPKWDDAWPLENNIVFVKDMGQWTVPRLEKI